MSELSDELPADKLGIRKIITDARIYRTCALSPEDLRAAVRGYMRGTLVHEGKCAADVDIEVFRIAWRPEGLTSAEAWERLLRDVDRKAVVIIVDGGDDMEWLLHKAHRALMHGACHVSFLTSCTMLLARITEDDIAGAIDLRFTHQPVFSYKSDRIIVMPLAA